MALNSPEGIWPVRTVRQLGHARQRGKPWTCKSPHANLLALDACGHLQAEESPSINSFVTRLRKLEIGRVSCHAAALAGIAATTPTIAAACRAIVRAASTGWKATASV